MRLADYAYIELQEASGMIIKDIENLYYKNNKKATWAHVCKVAKTCEHIATLYDLDIETCQLAAYLHDISAIIKPADMLEYYIKKGETLDEAEEKYPFLLHQRISKDIAKDHFNVTDERVLSAIHYHTTLRSNPSAYDMAIFIADKLSWDQSGEPPFYECVQRALSISLESACLAYIDYVFSNGMILCPHAWALEAQKYLRKVVNNTKEVANAYDIILVGGASGVGKSSISDTLSKRLDMNVVLVDDFQCIVEHFTREEDYPVFHYWTKHFEDAVKLPMEQKLEVMLYNYT